MSINLTADQSSALSAIRTFLADESLDAFILRGGAGTGKTTLVGKLVEVLEHMNLSCALLAPTGRAARILGNKVSEMTGRDVAAATVHSCIYVLDRIEVNETASDPNDPGIRMVFPLKEVEPTVALYIIDESSMLGDKKAHGDYIQFGSGRILKDIVSFCRLRRTGREDDHVTKLLFVGDTAQLPPIGEDSSPALSAEYLSSEYGLETSEFDLDRVMRQAEESTILERATEIRRAISAGIFNSFSLAADGNDIVEVDEGQALDIIERSLTKKSSSVVVVPSNAAALEYNRSVRARLWGNADLPIQEHDILLVNRNSASSGLRNGDLVKVMQVGSEPETVIVPVRGSGPVELRFRSAEVAFREYDGSVVKLGCFLLENLLESPNRELSPLEQRALLIHFRNRHPGLQVKSDEFRQLIRQDPYFNALQVKYGYAMTCHKAQGGEWDTVVVDFSNGGGVRNASFFRWAYTAITRASKNLVVVRPPEFDMIDVDMWGEVTGARSAAHGLTAQAQETDPDWHRLSFSASIASLLPIHQNLRDQWEAKGIRVDRLQHLQYCERYTLLREEARAVVQYYYNARHQMTRFNVVPGHDLDPELAEDALSAFKMPDESRKDEAPNDFIKDFLHRLDTALAGSGIQRTNYKKMPYRLRVGFSDLDRSGQVDFTYDKKFTWTKAQEVGGPGATGGLYDDIQNLMTSGER